MYDGLEKIPIDKLNFRQLRERMQILQDRYETLIRRYPELSHYGGSSAEGVDWANIVTPLIHATVNRLRFKASQNYDDLVELEDGPPGADADKNAVYLYDDLYWYWNGNEWVSTPDKDICSVFEQKPAGFSLKGVLEVQTDTGGRLTISDSLIKMYPAGTNDPKIQFGYYEDKTNPENPVNNPVVILGTGADTATKEVMGYPVRYGQAIVLKTATSVVIGMVNDTGAVHYLELKAQQKSDGEDAKTPGCYYSDGTAEMRLASTDDLTRLQEQIDDLKTKIEGS